IIPAEGVLTRRSPTAEEWEDIRLGFETAKEIGRLGVGQCVVVKRRGFVAVKVSKPQQDLRFDVPAVGVDTIIMMRGLKGTVLAVEAGRTILIEKDELIAEADRTGIAVVGVSEKLLQQKTHSA